MDTFYIPPRLIDASLLPPLHYTSTLGTFAYNTLKVRIPRILQETIAENDFPPDILAAADDLYNEVTRGEITPICEQAPDQAFWNAISREYIGRTWLNVPWFWAEAYFYRRVLQATRYFQPGDWHHVDPYRIKKQLELDTAPSALEAALSQLPTDRRARFELLFHHCLWGNRTDLSYNVSAAIQQRELGAERENILADDTEIVWEFLSQPRQRLAYVTDNAGTELLNDLALIDFLLSESGETPPHAGEITMHLKSHPYFVSDAMPRDVDAALDALEKGSARSRELAHRLRSHLEAGRLRLTAHWFYTTSLFYFQLPRDLLQELASMDFVIIKGDANYRRLLGDAAWEPTASFAQATAYFPAPFVALRTFKSELVVGLASGLAERLRQQESDWLVNGKRGVIQARI